ncbi:MAG: L,D-transpeptidase family protein [Lachnospiraceae bacterium]|nr:L,D-transpeptidase family protein [Lachnospiraceae bacterium]
MTDKSRNKNILRILISLLLIILAYLGMGIYYKDTFSFGTWINGKYGTGQTVEAMNTLLMEQENEYQCKIIEPDGTVEILYGNDFQYQKDYKNSLNHMMSEQNPFLWGADFLSDHQKQIDGTGSYQKEQAINKIKELSIYQQASKQKSPTVSIVMGEDGYELIDETQNAIDPEKLVNIILEAMNQSKSVVNLSDKDSYKSYLISEQMEETKALFDKVEAAQSTKITYITDDNSLTIGRKEIAQFLQVDEKGAFILDELGDLTISENKVEQYADKIGDTFDTLGKDREFKSSNGKSVSVNNGTYGYLVDREAEKSQIISSVLFHINQERAPFFMPSELDIGTGEIGDTYIEVDMSNQMLYYYCDGMLYLKSDVVTGAVNRGRGTPEKICYIYMKQKNRTLKGANYSAFVNYWMPVYGNIGLHDANWRKKFGGDIYKDGGSHGCINLPKETAEKIFDKVTIGTPVIMYYQDK